MALRLFLLPEIVPLDFAESDQEDNEILADSLDQEDLVVQEIIEDVYRSLSWSK